MGLLGSSILKEVGISWVFRCVRTLASQPFFSSGRKYEEGAQEQQVLKSPGSWEFLAKIPTPRSSLLPKHALFFLPVDLDTASFSACNTNFLLASKFLFWHFCYILLAEFDFSLLWPKDLAYFEDKVPLLHLTEAEKSLQTFPFLVPGMDLHMYHLGANSYFTLNTVA